MYVCECECMCNVCVKMHYVLYELMCVNVCVCTCVNVCVRACVRFFPDDLMPDSQML